ncbi:type 1 glutamine amidotransferase domain-containing protein [Streptomyces sp. NPDC057287]|uniref:type 1 glutamine amidotransferase domain-containing protein n=1 Tax=Streptomyces sp. NPDC057287 TaxID=3346086 RepID=UPI00362BBA93
MTDDLGGRRVLAIVSNYGVEQDELVLPVRQMRAAGATVDIAAVSKDPVRTLVGDKDPGEPVRPTLTLADADPADYDLLLVPGGTLNADTLRLQEATTRIVHSFTTTGRPVAAICHGPWVLVESDVVRGKTLTSYPSLRTDIRNAGGSWVDTSVAKDDGGGWTLITSRTPKDLDDFISEIGKELSTTA